MATRDYETPWVYLAVPKELRERFDRETPRLEWAPLEAEVREALYEPTNAICGLLEMPLHQDHWEPRLNLSYLKRMFDYAFHGLPILSSLKHLESDQVASHVRWWITENFMDCLHLSDLYSAFENAEGKPVPGIIAVINAGVARARLDLYRLTGECVALSVTEVALLARMREISVRNAATPKSPTPLETYKDADGVTSVTGKEAHRWLAQRRAFKPTQMPENEIIKQGMAEAFDEWAL